MKNKEMIGTTWVPKDGFYAGNYHNQDVAVILSCKGRGKVRHGEAMKTFTIDGDKLTRIEKYIGNENEIIVGGDDFLFAKIFVRKR